MPRKEAQASNGRSKPALVARLEDPAAYDEPVQSVRVAETHISWVFLAGKHAYKVKKPVKLPFVDFSTLERRREYCEEEVRLNRRLAPDLYLGVVPIGGDARSPRVGEEPAIEYAVKMRQFPDDARLDKQLGNAQLPRALREFGAALARFHSELPAVTPPRAGADAVDAMRDNFTELEKHLPRDELEPLLAWVGGVERGAAALIDARAARGRHRECHGDLHLENLLLDEGRVVAYDALEFDRNLREIDVASEAAFLLMDLCAHDRADLGYVFTTAYLEAGGDYDGLDVMRFYVVHRALVRAKVRAIKAAQKAAESGRETLAPYLELARAFTAPRTPLLVIAHGLSGSGKTFVTDGLIGPLRAVRVRSDVERKRLLGLAPDARTHSPVGGGSYDETATERTYARLAEVAATALRNGFDAIVDATFLRRSERERFRALAESVGARFAILDCDAPEAVLRKRVAARDAAGRDASEAGTVVLEAQLRAHEPLGADEEPRVLRVATDRDLDAAALAARLEAF